MREPNNVDGAHIPQRRGGARGGVDRRSCGGERESRDGGEMVVDEGERNPTVMGLMSD